MTTIKREFKDATCNISLALTTTPKAHEFVLDFESNKITQAKDTVKFKVDFHFPQNDTFSQENVYLAVLNYLLHYLYDAMAMMDAEENEFCEINNCLDDNLTHWQQGQIYTKNKTKLFHRASMGCSVTDIINMTEGKMKRIIELMFADIK